MELRVLQYFLAVAEAESITAAAKALHLTQPTLSKQLMDLEAELGRTLFLRGKRRITLTEEGQLLRKRAQDILDAVNAAAAELREEPDLRGSVSIGAGETRGMRLLADAAVAMRQAHPLVQFQLLSGNGGDIADRLDRGLLDFGLFIGTADLAAYDHLRLPVQDAWGVLMRKDDPLAALSAVTADDVCHRQLLCSQQAMERNELTGWMECSLWRLNVSVRYNLIYNASLMVEAGMGCALCLEGLIPTDEKSPLCFRPLSPPLTADLVLCWKKGKPLSRAANRFLEMLRARL